MFFETAERRQSQKRVPAHISSGERTSFFASARSEVALFEASSSPAQFCAAEVRTRPIDPLLGEVSFSNQKVGKLIVNADRLVLWASPALLAFLGSDSPLAISVGRIVATENYNQGRLEQLIEAACRDDRRHDTMLAAGDGGRGTTALQAKGCPGGEGRIAIQVRKFDEDLDLELPDFASLYGLTPARIRRSAWS